MSEIALDIGVGIGAAGFLWMVTFLAKSGAGWLRTHWRAWQ